MPAIVHHANAKNRGKRRQAHDGRMTGARLLAAILRDTAARSQIEGPGIRRRDLITLLGGAAVAVLQPVRSRRRCR
jgi:hypothetical protein